MKGIDISEHNGYIDFDKVKNDGIDFVIIRVGWIGNKENHTVDKYFEDYYKRAKAVGLKIGFYVYSYCNNESAILSGLRWCVNQLENKTYEYPLFLDLEDSSISNLSKTQLTNMAKLFCNVLQNDYNIVGGVYANLNWFTTKLNVNELEHFKIWLAQYTNSNTHLANFKVDLWQFTSQGTVNGVKGNVDINKCMSCEDVNVTEITGEKGGFDLKIYQNGSTKEIVYQDKNCSIEIGYLHAYETAECYGIVDNVAVIVYNIDNSNNKKVGFCKWLGGVK